MSPSLAFPTITHKPFRAPHSLELSILFKDFLSYWAGWPVHLDEEGRVAGSRDWKEWQVSFHGSLQGMLTLKTTRRLVGALWEAQSFKGRDFPDAESAFRELAALYATYLAQSLWKDRFLGLDPLMARPVGTVERPSPFQCHTYSRLWMKGEPLEIRCWLDPNPASRRAS
ncbi:MAG TPA: hypothetical protein VHE12_01925 [bacterium]|nr:hypothetical protein [bacterium]